MKYRRVLFTGGRKYDNYGELMQFMHDKFPLFDKDVVFCQGEAKGLDLMIKGYLKGNGYPVFGMDAQWIHYKDAAGSLRNKWMRDFFMPDLLIAFPGGSGTANMIELCNEKQITIWRVEHML